MAEYGEYFAGLSVSSSIFEFFFPLSPLSRARQKSPRLRYAIIPGEFWFSKNGSFFYFEFIVPHLVWIEVNHICMCSKYRIIGREFPLMERQRDFNYLTAFCES